MRDHCITFRSVTYAQKGESTVHRAGIACSMQRTPRWMEEQGCGYCLRLQEKDIPAAVALLRRKQIPFRKVYRQSEDAGVEEIRI